MKDLWFLATLLLMSIGIRGSSCLRILGERKEIINPNPVSSLIWKQHGQKWLVCTSADTNVVFTGRKEFRHQTYYATLVPLQHDE